MLTEKLFDSRKSKFIDYSELSKEFIANENNETKLKKRKSKIFLIFSNKRKLRMTPDSLNINLNLNNTANFLKIFTLINNKEEKTNLIHCLFTKNISQAKQILFNYQQADYNFLSTSGFILDIIEKNDEIIELIINKKENINHLIKIMNLIGNGDISYDYNYIMITANLLIYSKSIDRILKKEIDHDKIINLILENETILSYTYLFYIYAYLFHFEIKQIENYENVLDSLIFMIANQNQKDIDILIEDIYDIFVLLSKVPKFVNKFFNNYDIIFRNGEFNWNDLLIEQKLSIISNILKNTNSNEIQLLFKKDNGNILNLVKISLQLLSKMQKNKNEIFINIDKNDLNLIMLNIKILLTITYHKDLTDLLLENKEYFNLIILIFSEIISLKDINNNKILMNFEISKINEIYNIFFKIVNNIIKNEHKLFISQIISNNLHLQIKEKFNYYIIYNFINEKHFISLINIICSLYDNQKKDKIKTEVVKLDLDNNRFNDVIIGIIKKFGHNEIINNKCTNFLDIYYPSEPQKNFLQLTDFNFLNLNI
jgi:hypothetical protein